MLVAIFWIYTRFGIRLCAAVMLPKFFSAAKILPNPKLKKKEIKEKNFYAEFSV